MGQSVTTVGSEKKRLAPELKKHAAAIHCSNPLSLLQRKVSNALLYHAYEELMTKEEHEISIKQLCKLIEYNGNNHAAIKEAMRGLLSTVIEWNVVNDGTGTEDWTASSIIASVSLRGATCFYAYSPRMKQLFHSPSMFGKINLYIQSRFKSSYGLALYENCIRYKGLPFTKWFEMDTFRKLMGVPKDNYIIFRDFKRRVLDKSIEEVNTYSDMLVEPELIRDKRQVIKIRFALKERAKRARLGMPMLENAVEDTNKEAEIKEPEVITREIDLRSILIMKFCLSPAQTEKILQEYSRSFIFEKMQIVELSSNFKNGKVKNIAGYFLSALRDNYQPVKSSTEQIQKEQADLNEQKRLSEKIEAAYLAYREKKIDQALSQMAAVQKEQFMQQFYLYAAIPIKTTLQLQHARYTKNTVLNSPQIKGLLRQFAVQTLPELQAQLISLEKFSETTDDCL
jgi:plasmid replication initiation protein